MIKHKKAHNEGVRYRCHFCSKMFESHAYFKLHLKEHNSLFDGNKATCSQCSKTVGIYYLKTHLELHKEDK